MEEGSFSLQFIFKFSPFLFHWCWLVFLVYVWHVFVCVYVCVCVCVDAKKCSDFCNLCVLFLIKRFVFWVGISGI